ncbi:MAG TPA: polyprenyl synthetase family protein [Chthoniobacterales bacterium]|nr:polyprenyl synthetase family protein [Chthoniobacterales bacterium]
MQARDAMFVVEIDDICNPHYDRLVKIFTKPALQGVGAAKLQRAVELINPHLYTVEQRIREQAKGFDPAIEAYFEYACGSSGKRLRPVLTLLAGAATGPVRTSHVDLAVIVELIHLATLVHDDIMDGAEIRRGQPTVNAKWGNTLAVLLGDCLFAHALELAAAFPDNEICRRIAHAAKEVCSGEIVQTQRRFDLNLTIEEYFQVIEMKTAALFAVATELGAFISETDIEVITALKSYGFKLGTAYQIYDDCLDIAGTEDKAGKTLGSDLRKGKLTLPVLYLLQTVKPEEHHRFSEVLLRSNSDELDGLAAEVARRGALRRAVDTTKRLVAEAQLELQKVPINKYSRAMLDIGDFLSNIVDQFADAA